MISSMLEPASRFSKTVATGIRVLRNTHAPLRLPGTLSTAGHCDQSRAAMFLPSFYGSRSGSFLPRIWRRRHARVACVAARISIEDGAFFKGGIDIRKAGGKPEEVKAASASMSAAEPAIAARA